MNAWIRKASILGDILKNQDWAAFAAGEPDIWRLVLDEAVGKLYAMFLKSWPNRSLAEELVQKTVFDAVKGREKRTQKPAQARTLGAQER